jgi:hypothetical protein
MQISGENRQRLKIESDPKTYPAGRHRPGRGKEIIPGGLHGHRICTVELIEVDEVGTKTENSHIQRVRHLKRGP